MEHEYLTIAQVADLLKLSVRTINRYIKIGRIRVIRLGTWPKGAVRIKASELDRLEQISYEENMEELRKELLEE